MLIDYHIHNRFSPDSESKTMEIAKKAMEMGIQEICITNHVEVFPPEGGIGQFTFAEAHSRFLEVKKDIQKTQKKFPTLPIRFGVELEYIKEWMPEMKRFVEAMDFDFLIGSMHIVDDIVISSHLHAGDLYDKIKEEEAYTKYFDLLYDLVKWGEFDVVGHFDINKKYGHEHYGPFQPQKYKNEIMSILKLMKQKGIGIELNTAAMHQKCKELFPHPDILKWCLETGIEHYTIGSDAHEAKDVGRHLDKAISIAKKAGIREISTYKKRQPTKHAI